jgi:sigma-B regulation protein RsbU (phosphoserine phosphatase)
MKYGEQILIVDDTPENLQLLTQILAERNYHVRAVTSGARALESASLSVPDLILLDIKMPGLDGFEVCRQLKANPRTAPVPVIFISALDNLSDKMRAFHAGGVDYITKPFQYEEVAARAATHLSLRRLQKQLQSAYDQMAHQLEMAGILQRSFLPNRIPEVPGWQFAVKLLPALETSGDFYDIFCLPDGRIGLLVADVVDKGVCAALFMSLCFALFRTNGQQYGYEPAAVFRAVNEHILGDTRANQFVTAFYALLDPLEGRMVYANAGHCPPLLFRQSTGLPEGRVAAADWLYATGIPLGILEESSWEQREFVLAPGDRLLLYTDGLIEAENASGEQFGRRGLQAVVEGSAPYDRLSAMDPQVRFPQQRQPEFEIRQASPGESHHTFDRQQPASGSVKTLEGPANADRSTESPSQLVEHVLNAVNTFIADCCLTDDLVLLALGRD